MRGVLAIAIAILVAVLVWLAWPRKKPATRAQGPRADPTPTLVASTAAAPQKSDDVRVIPFDVLGVGKTSDGRLVAPSSFLAEADGIVVLDQENQRILRADGTSIPLPSKHADDIARTKDGFAILDRTGAKEVTLLDGTGRVRGHLPIPEEPRSVSRLFVSGDDVLVERNGGGPLLRLGSVDGTPSRERTEIQGIPTRDGKSLVSAGITSEDDGRAWVTLADRQAVHRWTRELRFLAALSAVGFLDSDTNGTIWVVLLAGSTPQDFVNWAVCLEPSSGKMKASFTLQVENPPYESFRDFAVQDGTGLVAATRGSSGVAYATYRCP